MTSASGRVVIVAVLVAFFGVMAPDPAAATPEPPDTIPAATNVDGSSVDDGSFADSGDLEDCLGLVQRPNCGGSGNGGWRQAAVLGAIVVGLGVITWRVVRAARR